MKRTSKILVCCLLVLVLLIGCFSLVACDKKEGSSKKKAIVMVTALMSGGLYDKSNNKAVWDPLYFDFDQEGSENLTLVKFLQLLYETDDMMNSPLFSELVSEVMATDVSMVKDRSGDPYASFMEYAMDAMLSPMVDFPDLDDEDAVAAYKENYGSLFASLLYNLQQDEDGNSLNTNIVPANDYTGPHKHIAYGVMGCYEDQVKTLQKEYPDYDVVIFNYDWRLDGNINAQLFTEWMDEKDYDEIVLTTHSLGGQICNRWLAEDPKHRRMTKAFVMYAPATLGTTAALCFLNNVWDLLDPFPVSKDMTTGDSTLDMLLPTVLDAVEPILNEQGMPFIRNCSSIIQLLPSWQLVNTYHEADGIWILTDVDGNDITSEDELFNFYYSHEWAWKTKNGKYIFSDGTEMSNEDVETFSHPSAWTGSGKKPALKKVISELRDWQHKLYVKAGDKEYLAADYVNTYYLIGDIQKNNGNTVLTYDESANVEFHYNWDDTGSAPNKYTMGKGDDMVVEYCALGGKTEAQITEMYGEGHVVRYNHDHNIVGADFSGVVMAEGTGVKVREILKSIGW